MGAVHTSVPRWPTTDPGVDRSGRAFAITWLIATVVERTIGLRLSREVETEGVDIVVHGERAYDLDGHVHAPLADIIAREREVVASAEAAVSTDATITTRD